MQLFPFSANYHQERWYCRRDQCSLFQTSCSTDCHLILIKVSPHMCLYDTEFKKILWAWMPAWFIKTNRTSASEGIWKEVISSHKTSVSKKCFNFFFCRQPTSLWSFNTPEISWGLNNLVGDRYLASTKVINQAMKFFSFFTDEIFLEKGFQKAFLQWDGKAFEPCICNLFK